MTVSSPGTEMNIPAIIPGIVPPCLANRERCPASQR
jgi:hypothetical protein